jgi:hypothetical protein
LRHCQLTSTSPKDLTVSLYHDHCIHPFTNYSHTRITTVHGQSNPGNPPRILTRQKHRRPRNVLRRAQAPERVHSLYLFALSVCFRSQKTVDERRLHVAWTQRVDVDPVWSTVVCGGFGEAHDSVFGSYICG